MCYECNKNKGFGRDNYASNICYKCEYYNKILDINDGLCKKCLEDWCEEVENIIEDEYEDPCSNITCGNITELNDDSLLGICFVFNNEPQCLCSSLFEGSNCTSNKLEELHNLTNSIEKGEELNSMKDKSDDI